MRFNSSVKKKFPRTEVRLQNVIDSPGPVWITKFRKNRESPFYAIFRIAWSMRASVVSRPITSRVSNKGGAFFRPQTATRIG